jgi:hypothetical protein
MQVATQYKSQHIVNAGRPMYCERMSSYWYSPKKVASACATLTRMQSGLTKVRNASRITSLVFLANIPRSLMTTLSFRKLFTLLRGSPSGFIVKDQPLHAGVLRDLATLRRVAAHGVNNDYHSKNGGAQQVDSQTDLVIANLGNRSQQQRGTNEQRDAAGHGERALEVTG